MNSKFLNGMEIMNEVTLFFTSYFLYLFTSFVPNTEMRYEMGWYFIGVAALNIFLNWLAMIYKFIEPLVAFIQKKRANCKKAKKQPLKDLNSNSKYHMHSNSYLRSANGRTT